MKWRCKPSIDFPDRCVVGIPRKSEIAPQSFVGAAGGVIRTFRIFRMKTLVSTDKITRRSVLKIC